MKYQMPTHFELKLQKKFEELLYKEDVLENNFSTPDEVTDSFRLFHEKFCNDKLYEFSIFGENGAYKPVFKIKDGKIYSACNCRSGVKDEFCWHRSYVLAGKTKRLTNPDHYYNLKEMIDELKNSQVATPSVTNQYTTNASKSSTFRRMSFSGLFMFFTSIF